MEKESLNWLAEREQTIDLGEREEQDGKSKVAGQEDVDKHLQRARGLLLWSAPLTPNIGIGSGEDNNDSCSCTSSACFSLAALCRSSTVFFVYETKRATTERLPP